MEKKFILHMLTTEKNLSPFDVVMALDAGWVTPIPYTNIKLDDIRGLIQDAIFARSPKALKKTGVFIGGRDFKLVMELLFLAKKNMVPPFEVSVLADPSGAFTSAAANIAFIERKLETAFNTNLNNKKVLILSGSGPVGQVSAILLAKAGAEVTIISRKLTKAQQIANKCNSELVNSQNKVSGAAEINLPSLIKTADIILTTAPLGMMPLSRQLLLRAKNLKICVDVNPVPPYGIEGIDPYQHDQPIPGCHSETIGIGALALGDIKYNVQHLMLKQLSQCEKPIFLHYEHAYQTAKIILAS
jgi:methylene-tetrahydromethanopterin dehydrogenase